MSQIDHAIHIKTVFCDLDGCVFKHQGNTAGILLKQCELLPGASESFSKWFEKGYTVIITTGRPESLRDFTIQQIRNSNLYYHYLIMNLPRGQRVVINDIKPNETMKTAACVNIERNKGMENVDI